MGWGPTGRFVGTGPGRLGVERLRNNILSLFAALAIGQGSLFLSQSWLVYHGELRLVGLFGSSFAVALLLYGIVDWGGIVLLARHRLAGEVEGETSGFYWALTAVRLIIASVCVAAIVIWTSTARISFASGYAIAVAPALLLGAFQMGGLLDGLRRSGVSGLSSMLPMLTSAIVLPGAGLLSPAAQGLLLGAAFSVGGLLSIAVQYWLLAALGETPVFVKPDLRHVSRAAREGGLILLTNLPGYLAYRIQIAISLSFLGAAGTGLFIYARTAVNGVLQIFTVVRRTEFPRLVEAMARRQSIHDVFVAQRGADRLGIALALGVALSAFVVGARIERFAAAGTLIASFGPAMLLSVIYNSLHQGYLAAGYSGKAAAVANLCFAVAIPVTIAAISFVGMYGFAITEAMTNLVAFLILVRIWPKDRGASAVEEPPRPVP